MRTNLEFAPFHQSSVGFDRLFNLLENASRQGSSGHLPLYDIIRLGQDAYRIVVAVPGFRLEDMELTQQPNLLLISGNVRDIGDADYLHRGIERRSFVLRFGLADYVDVTNANLADGLLAIDLKRDLPQAMKPRKIMIDGDVEPNQIDGSSSSSN